VAQLIAIRTSALEEKATACSLIGCYIGDLGAAFYPHVQATVEIMVPLLKFYADEGARDPWQWRRRGLTGGQTSDSLRRS
jgi:hypothetical protein